MCAAGGAHGHRQRGSSHRGRSRPSWHSSRGLLRAPEDRTCDRLARLTDAGAQFGVWPHRVGPRPVYACQRVPCAVARTLGWRRHRYPAPRGGPATWPSWPLPRRSSRTHCVGSHSPWGSATPAIPARPIRRTSGQHCTSPAGRAVPTYGPSSSTAASVQRRRPQPRDLGKQPSLQKRPARPEPRRFAFMYV